ncbi:MAG TPA: hypothetical protein VGE07_11545 [Herpetosiphonaceae bacterium]
MNTITAQRVSIALSSLSRQGYHIDQLTDTLWQVVDPFTRTATVQPTGALIALADRFAPSAARAPRSSAPAVGDLHHRPSAATKSVTAATWVASVSLAVNSQP